MSSFLTKLARLPASISGAPPIAAPAASSPEPEALAAPPLPALPVLSGLSARPSLDDLRDRIARIVARDVPLPPRADPTRGELPFVLQHTPTGPPRGSPARVESRGAH